MGGVLTRMLGRAAAGGGGIEFVGAASANKVKAAGTTTIDLSTGLAGGSRSAVAEGDIVIAAYGVGNQDTENATLDITDGTTSYTLIGSELYMNDSSNANLRVAYKFMGATPDASVTFPDWDVADGGAGMVVFVFSGVNQSTPLDVAATTAQSGNSARADPPSITPITAGAFVVCVGGGSSFSSQTQTAFTSSDLTGFVQTLSQVGINPRMQVGVGYHEWTSGAFNAAAFGGANGTSTSAWAALSLALRPA